MQVGLESDSSDRARDGAFALSSHNAPPKFNLHDRKQSEVVPGNCLRQSAMSREMS